MELVREKDRARFIVGASTHSIDDTGNKRALERRVEKLKQIYPTEFCVITKSPDSKLNFIFSDHKGYSLGECARIHFGKKNLIWVEEFGDGKTLFVVIREGVVVNEKLLEDGHIDDITLATIKEAGTQYDVTIYGELPVSLDELIKEGEYIHGCEILATPAFIKLPTPSDFLFKPLQEALQVYQKSGSGGVILTIIAAVVFVAVYLWPEEKPPIQLIDHYKGYRDILRSPSASQYLVELYEVLQSLSHHFNWRIVTCKFETGILLCRFAAMPSGRASDLRELKNHIGRPVTIDLEGAEGVAMIPIDSPLRHYQDSILPTNAVVSYLRDALHREVIPSGLLVKKPIKQEQWSSQQLVIDKTGTFLYDLLAAAAAVKGTPSTLDALTVDREGDTLKLQMKISAHGKEG